MPDREKKRNIIQRNTKHRILYKTENKHTKQKKINIKIILKNISRVIIK